MENNNNFAQKALSFFNRYFDGLDWDNTPDEFIMAMGQLEDKLVSLGDCCSRCKNVRWDEPAEYNYCEIIGANADIDGINTHICNSFQGRFSNG